MKDLLKSQDETILVKVNNVFKSEVFKDGKLPCPAKDPILKKDVVVATANEYEQAIMITLIEMQSQAAKEKVNSKNLASKSLYDLFWGSVGIRLSDETLEYDALLLKENWQIAGSNFL